MIRPATRRVPRLGFTLIEMLVVLIILAMIATGVAIRLKPIVNEHRKLTAISEVLSIDRNMRRRAMQDRMPTTIFVDIDRGSIRQTKNGSATRVIARELPVSFVSSDSDTANTSISFRPDGSSATYAIGFGESESTSKVLLVLGGTGQHRVFTFDEFTAWEQN